MQVGEVCQFLWLLQNPYGFKGFNKDFDLNLLYAKPARLARQVDFKTTIPSQKGRMPR